MRRRTNRIKTIYSSLAIEQNTLTIDQVTAVISGKRVLAPPKDIKLPGSPISEGESAFPDADALPDDEPIYRYDGGDSNLALLRTIKYIVNPFVKDCYYYQIEIPTKDFMAYAARIDGSPNTILAAMLYKMSTRFLKEKKDTHLSVRIADDYRSDIGADESYRDFVRLIHIRYEWDMKDESIEKLNMRARGAIIKQNQAEPRRDRRAARSEVEKAICRKEQYLPFRSPRQLYGQLCRKDRLGRDGSAYQGTVHHH